jgi:REP element-mobilizing transposase RayT
MAFEFIDPRNTPWAEPRSRGELPHLYKEGGSYFVTFRLLNAVDTKKRRRDGGTTTRTTTRRQKKHTLSPEQQAVLVARETEPPLRLGSCALLRPEIAESIQHALRHFHGQRYHLSAWCVMPNHVHVVVTPNDGWELSAILHSWKSFTAHQANKSLKRQGAFCERESFDHLIRTVEHFEAFVHYVENNPVEARLCQTPEDWAWSSAHLRKNAARTAAPQRKDK